MEPTPAGSVHAARAAGLNYRISPSQLERYLKQILDMYLYKATSVELKLCLSRTTRRRKGSSRYSMIVHVISTRKSPRHHWERRSTVWRLGRGRYSKE